MSRFGAFLQNMAGPGLGTHKPSHTGDRRSHRYQITRDTAGLKNGWYGLILDGRPFGDFSSRRTDQSCAWTADSSERMTKADQQALRERMAVANASSGDDKA